MKVAFLTRFDLSQESGVLKKIVNQIKQWKNNGFDVVLFAQTHSPEIWSGLNDIEVQYVLSKPINSNSKLGSLKHRFQSMSDLMSKLDDWSPDVVFYRFTTYYPSISKMMNKYPFVLEINTDDIQEYKLKFGFLKNLYHRTFRKVMLKKAKGMITVTRDLIDKFDEFKCPKIAVANSIDLLNFDELPAPNNERPRFVFIGTPNRAWHGVRKILDFAELRPEYDFDLIGPQSNDFNQPLTSNVYAHGYLQVEEYLPIMKQADVAVGSLAFHMIPLEEACPLKVREYLAYGIPTILPYTDTDFIDNQHPLVLQISNSENNLKESAEVLDDFILKAKGKRILRSNIQFIDSSFKEKEKLEFISSIFQGS